MARSASGQHDPDDRGNPAYRADRNDPVNPDELTVAELLGREGRYGMDAGFGREAGYGRETPYGRPPVMPRSDSPRRKLAVTAGVVLAVGSMVATAAVFGRAVPGANGSHDQDSGQTGTGFPEPPRPDRITVPPPPGVLPGPDTVAAAPGPGRFVGVAPLAVLAAPTADSVTVDVPRSGRGSSGRAGSGRGAGALAAHNGAGPGSSGVVSDVAGGVGDLTSGVGDTLDTADVADAPSSLNGPTRTIGDFDGSADGVSPTRARTVDEDNDLASGPALSSFPDPITGAGGGLDTLGGGPL